MKTIFAFYLLMNIASHFSGSTPTRLGATQSTTNMDSNYVACTGHVGTIGDSLADSIFIPVQGNSLPSFNAGIMDIGVQTADTLTDSIQVLRNHIIVFTKAIKGSGAHDIFFPFGVSTTAYSGVPDLWEFIPKMKKKAGKGAHLVRINFNYIGQY